MVDLPQEMGGGSAVVIGFGSQSSLFPGALCLFDLDGDLDIPIWRRTIHDGPIPTQVPKPAHDLSSFVPAKVWTYDIFHNLQGAEIIVAFEYAVSQCAIRIYDLRGELLYQRWHDGTLAFCYWMADAGVLFFAGLNSEHDMDDRGHPGLPNPHARVLFGLTPVLGSITSEILSPDPGEGRATALWYRCLLPPRNAARLTWVSCDPPRGGYDPGRTVEVTVFVKADPRIGAQLGAAVSWIIDERGRFVPESRVLSDDYRRYQKQLPDPEAFLLGDLPPVVNGPKQELPP